MLRDRVRRSGGGTALVAVAPGAPAEWPRLSWPALGEQVDAVARALVALGVPELDRVGIWSANRMEWTVADFGILSARATSVPIYATSTAAQAGYILEEAGIEVVFVGGQTQYDRAVALGHGRVLVALDPAVRFAPGARSLRFDELLALGRDPALAAEVEARLERATPEDLATLIYTSGTTGEPRGVMLTHANFGACFAAHDARLPATGESDRSLCFLPLAHVFERTWTYYVLYRGMTNHYLSDPAQVLEAMAAVRPTIQCAVPRFYEKLHAGIERRLATAPPARRRIFRWAVATGARVAERERRGRAVPPLLRLRHALADALVLKKLRALTGGCVRFFPCAGAPIARELEEFFDAVGLRIAHGYGLTETTATVTVQEFDRYVPGTVGTALPGIEVRLGADAEVLVRGATVMKGYFGKPEATAAAFVDGWLKTGDAGAFDAEGNLVITDRLKDLIKTSGGKYVAPQQIEAQVGGDGLIAQVAVIGDLRKYVAALIVPAFEALEERARALGVAFRTRAELIADPRVVALYQERVDAHNRALAPWAQIRRFRLLPRELSVDEGEITPTLKLRRQRLAEEYAELVEAMYAEA